MSFRNPSHPGEVRAVLHAGYERYAAGIDMFPRVQWPGPTELLPAKTQPVAQALERAWAEIDGDRLVFDATIRSLFDRAVRYGEEGRTDERMITVQKIGRNSVNLAVVTSTPDLPDIHMGVFSQAEFAEGFDGHTFQMADGRQISWDHGVVVGDFNGIIQRGPHLMGVAMAHPQSGSPVSVPRNNDFL